VLMLIIVVPLVLLLAFSLPIGIWALFVLMRNDVRQAFDVER
jgi:hypothetical protein